jgi:tetratricopeptide (TPR) repeat protein
VLTRLEIFRLSRGISPEALNGECSYSRQHILRVRLGRHEPSRDFIAATVSAMRRLSLEDVRADDLYELTVEESGAWRERDDERLAQVAKTAELSREARLRAVHLVRALAGTPDTWAARLHGESGIDPDVFVRALILEGRRVRDGNAERAERLFKTAIVILDGAHQLPSDYRAFLRGTARVEQANALRHRGRLRDALSCIDLAEMELEGRPLCTHELARAWFVRGTVLFKTGALSDALPWLRRAVNLFTAVDDERRVARVRVVEANVLYEQRRVDEACALWRSTLAVFSAARDRKNEGVVWLNLAWCALDMDQAAEAKEWLEKARARFETAGAKGELARSRWGLALHEARYGERSAGIARLKKAQDELSELGLALDAAMVYLDIAETFLLPPARPREAKALGKKLTPLFREAGAGREALRALAYLAEAARANRLSPVLVRRVRGDVRQAISDQGFSFAPPNPETQ